MNKLTCKNCKSENMLLKTIVKTKSKEKDDRVVLKCRDCSTTTSIGLTEIPVEYLERFRKPSIIKYIKTKRKDFRNNNVSPDIFTKRLKKELNKKCQIEYIMTNLNTLLILKEVGKDNQQIILKLNQPYSFKKTEYTIKELLDTGIIDISVFFKLVWPEFDSTYKDKQSWKNFHAKLQQNEYDPFIKQQLPIFVEYGNLPILENGNFIAYKYVIKNKKNKYVSEFDKKTVHTLHTIVEVNNYSTDCNIACAQGLHAATFDYVQTTYGTEGHEYDDDAIIIGVEIDPRDVVAVPYNETNKIRCKKYIPRLTIDIQLFNKLMDNSLKVALLENAIKNM
jgi:RNase P subunit RPR2